MRKITSGLLIILLIFQFIYAKNTLVETTNHLDEINYISALKDTLTHISERSDNAYFKLHLHSMVNVIEAEEHFNQTDVNFIKDTYEAFENEENHLKDFSTYLDRKRPLIISWVSPTDGQTSFAYLTLPANWNPDEAYPLYVDLHGSWYISANPITFMTYPFLVEASGTAAFEDGYWLSPWGRGNKWYQGIAETDIWEAQKTIENLFTINPYRKYLLGHSMGGYGVWHIAHGTAELWAAIGISSGALYYEPDEITERNARNLKNVPVYFVCGDSDSFLEANQNTYVLLENTGNENLYFHIFEGGHVYHEMYIYFMYLWLHNFTNTDLYINAVEEINTENQFSLSVSPNPFTDFIKISYTLEKAEKINIHIFDEFAHLKESISIDKQTVGRHEYIWEPQQLKSGIYILRISNNTFSVTKKIVYLHK